MNWKLTSYVVIVLLIFGAGFYFKSYTGSVVLGETLENYTQPICYKGQCIDVYVECTEQGVKVTPISTTYVAINITEFNISNYIRC